MSWKWMKKKMNNDEKPVNTGEDTPETYRPGEYSHAAESKITTPEQDEAKIKKLDEYFDQKIKAHVDVLTANLQEHGSKIDMIINALQQAGEQEQAKQAQQAPGVQAPEAPKPPSITDMANLSPEMKSEMLSGIAQIIHAIKGGGEPQEDYFSKMSKQITMNMLQAGVDGIMQNVYQNYKAVPPTNPLRQNTTSNPNEHHLQ